MIKSAEISECGRWRYRLTRLWDRGSQPLVFVLLNPSVADSVVDDPTIFRCISFARRDGFGGIEVLNLFALRTTQPARLKIVEDPVGPNNWRTWAGVLDHHKAVVFGWGASKGTDKGEQIRRLMKLCHSRHVQPTCLGTTKDGSPRHPLFLGSDTQREGWPK